LAHGGRFPSAVQRHSTPTSANLATLSTSREGRFASFRERRLCLPDIGLEPQFVVAVAHGQRLLPVISIDLIKK